MNDRAAPLGFAHVTLADAVARADALVPALRARGDTAEAARQLLPETVADLHSSGLFRSHQPKRWGGMELDFVATVDLPAAIGRGCASTAWNLGNLAVHHWMLALYDERAQAEVWGANPDALIASGIAYPQGRARAVDGGFIVSGYWNFSSSVDACEWNMLAAQVKDGEKVVDHRMCLVPRDDYEIVDDWHVLGMASTGSKSIRADDIFVPLHRALKMQTVDGKHFLPGLATNTHPNFAVPFSAFAAHPIGGAALGNAEAALELTIKHVKDRSGNYTGARMRDLQAVQLRVAAAGARIDAARYLMRQDCIEAQTRIARGESLTLEDKLRAKRNLAYAVQLCTEAVDTLHTLAGANGIYEKYPMSRIFRDAHALAGHFSFSWDAQASPWGLVALGGDWKSATI